MTNWTQLKHFHERLRWARMEAGYDKAKAAADALSINAVTYRSYERATEDAGREPKTLAEIQRIAAKFKVSWTWLAAGDGVPMIEQTIPPSVAEIWSRVPDDKKDDALAIWEAIASRKAS